MCCVPTDYNLVKCRENYVDDDIYDDDDEDGDSARVCSQTIVLVQSSNHEFCTDLKC